MRRHVRPSAVIVCGCVGIGLAIGYSSGFSWSSLWWIWWVGAAAWTIRAVRRRRRLKPARVPSEWFEARAAASGGPQRAGRFRNVPFGRGHDARDLFPRPSRRHEIAHFAGCLIINILLIVGFFVSLYLAWRAAPEIVSRQHE